jgi:hypothetical protein
MKTFRKAIQITTQCAGLALTLSLYAHPAAAQKIVANIDISKTAPPVSKYIFGTQAEPLPNMLCGCESSGAAWCLRP